MQTRENSRRKNSFLPRKFFLQGLHPAHASYIIQISDSFVNEAKEDTYESISDRIRPFGGEPINPAWEAVKAMKDTIAGAEIVKMQIPTVVGKSIEKIHQKMKELQPDLVISVGQAGGRFGVTPERVAINVTDARIPDNEGNQPIDEPIFPDGPRRLFF